ncbi:MAG: polysaccharide biosynthesis protein [Niameybacter sp.]|uniref:putative polysaccharide biosynthesis protein n=1 Tax=Niameybacter sp. TaxID=2033640 RepID=UPI002FC9C3E4
MEQKITGKQVAKGIMILTIATFISKLVGVVYRIPIVNILGDAGNAIYGLAYQVYVLIITVSCLGIPNAVSKLIAECMSLKAYQDVKRIFRITFIYTGIISIVLAFGLWFGAEEIAHILKGGEDIVLPLKALAPTVVVVSLMAVIRGYFQGLNDMMPTAISQVIEQLFNAVFSVLLAAMFIPCGIGVAAMGSTLGTGIGALAGMVTIVVIYQCTYKKYNLEQVEEHYYIYPSNRSIIKQLLITILPLVITAALFALITLIDNTMLFYYLPSTVDKLRSMGQLSVIPVTDAISMDTQTIVTSLSGQFLSKYTQFINIPVGIILVIVTSSIPAIAGDYARRDYKGLEHKMNRLLKMGMLIAMPATVGLTLFGEPIMKLVYASAPDGGSLFTVGAIAIVFMTLAQLTAGMLQAIGKQHRVTLYVAIALLVKIVLNGLLLGNPNIHIYGITISTTICYMIYTLFNMRALKKILQIKVNWKAVIIKPLICSVVMGIMSFYLYKVLLFIMSSLTYAILLVIAFAIVTYACMTFFTHTITIEDINYIPFLNKWNKKYMQTKTDK